MERQMTKDQAYSLKILGEKIVAKAKEKGLTLAEEAVETLAASVYLGMKDWAVESAVASENKIDDFIAPFYSQIDNFVLPQIQKLDLDGSGN
jgi:hypothetical protein